MALVAQCPSCAAEVAFKASTSLVVVCSYCGHVIGRGDRGFEDLGKVADLVDSGSPLELELQGIYERLTFTITGRVQLQHAAGGAWDEWYCWFSDGRWGWLAEAQGKFYLTFQSPAPALPPWDSLVAGAPVYGLAAQPLVVAERGQALLARGEGEIPYRFAPGETVTYADLSGPGGMFATIDYSDGYPVLYAGREVTLRDLGLAGRAAAPREAKKIRATKVSCPECDGALELRAPDKTERIGCPYCGALSDVSQGRLRLLKSLEGPKVPLLLDLGATGTIRGRKMTVIGFVARSVEFSGVRYPWYEYLLYEPEIGFRWLVHSDLQWSFVEPLGAGDVNEYASTVRHRGRSFKLYQKAVARVDYVVGELYWKVKAGETVYAVDYVAPPQMISRESSDDELNWSLGTFVPVEEVERGFGKKRLPRPTKPAPNQPYPHRSVYAVWGIVLVVAVVAGLIALATGARKQVHQASYRLDPPDPGSATRTIFSEPFALEGGKNIHVRGAAPVDNDWVYMEGDLVNEGTGLVAPFSLQVQHYHGVEGGEAWSEGSRVAKVFLSSVPSGDYTLRLEAQWGSTMKPVDVEITVEQGVPRPLYLLVLLGAVSLLPVLVLLHHRSFERRRWADSDFSPYE